MIVRLLIWNLADSKTSLEELQTRLEPESHRIWFSDKATERFGVVETWDDEPGELPTEIRDLIGKAPEIAEQFDVEA